MQELILITIKTFFAVNANKNLSVYRLADFMHRFIPEAFDDHLFTLETIVRAKIKKQKLCLNTLMGNREFTVELETAADLEIDQSNSDDEDINGNNEPPVHSFEYTSRIPVKTLRCLKP